jgi:hypothetical protein
MARPHQPTSVLSGMSAPMAGKDLVLAIKRNRHDNPDLLLITPPSPTLQPKNFSAHIKSHLRDVVKHVS